MSRFAKALFVLAAGFSFAVRAHAQADYRDEQRADEALVLYMERAGLHELLAGHLQRRLEETDGRRTHETAERLAQTYAELHRRALSLAEQAIWKDKTLALLERVPQADSIEYRLNFARGTFTQSERSAEQVLLRLDGAPPREEVRRSLVDLLAIFEEIIARSSQRVSSYERQLETARAVDTMIIDKALSEHQRFRSQASYLAGYTALYLARLSDESSAPASRAIRHFATVLNTDRGINVTPAAVAPNILAFDHVARAALGIALASALKPDIDSADEWFDLLEGAPDLPSAVTDDLAPARMQAHALAGRWPSALAWMRAMADEPLSPLEARRLAIIALTSEPRLVDAEDRDTFAQLALSSLISRNETGHVLQIVSAYDISGLNPSGFVGTYVRALKRYETARDEHRSSDSGGDDPTGFGALSAEYVRAGNEFVNALALDDASAYPRAEGSVRMLAGLSYYYAGPRRDNLLRASEQFELAWHRLAPDDPSRAANALWMSIRSLELHESSVSDQDLRVDERRDELLARFLERYPDHPRAHALVYSRATSGSVGPDDAIDDLLRIPSESTLHEPARRHAIRLLYTLLRDESRTPDPWQTTLFLDLSESVLEQDLRRAVAEVSGGQESKAALRAAMHARRVFDIAMSADPIDSSRAERAIDALASLRSLDAVAIESLEAEILYKRAKVEASRGNADAARDLATRAAKQDSRYEQAGDRLFFREAVDAWRRVGPSDVQGRARAARRVVEAGRPLLLELAGEDGEIPLDEPGNVSLVFHIASAADALWRLEQETAARDLAHPLFRMLARQHPSTLAYILPTARLETDLENADAALILWREIVAAAPSMTDAWLEAKLAIIRLHADREPARARSVLEQFRALHPEFSHPVWSPEFDKIERRLMEIEP